jgi:hypothetical protein
MNPKCCQIKQRACYVLLVTKRKENMRAIKTLQHLLSLSLVTIHKVRKESVFWAALSLILGSRLSLTALGRSARGHALTKHNIKRVDRLLKNAKLHKELPVFYRAIAALLIGGQKRPVIIVDWTGIGTKHSALVAAVPIDGRAIPVYIRVYSYKVNNNSGVEKRFLKKLKEILPSGCRPIIVTDAGFRNVWFKSVLALDWDFVGRIISAAQACPLDEGQWCTTHSLFKRAVYSAKDLGHWILAKSNPLKVRLITIKNRPTGRKTKLIGVKGAVEARKRARNPWLLATSLSVSTAKKIIKIYSVRFQIEESFRDTKNSRFGWSFRHSRSRTNARLEVLLLIATLGMLALMVVGQTAERLGIHRSFQANTVQSKRVLSLFFLGKNIILVEMDKTLLVRDFHVSIRDLKGKIICL